MKKSIKVLSSEKNRILSTTDYSVFNYDKYKIRQNTIKCLIEDIKKKNLNKDMPVMVDEEYNILERRHLFIALKTLRLPVYFKVCEVAEKLDFLIAKKYNKKASPFDFCIFHNDKANYREILNFVNDTPFTFMDTFSDILKIRVNMRSESYKSFQEGTYELGSYEIEKMNTIKKWLSFLKPKGYYFDDVKTIYELSNTSFAVFDKILSKSKQIINHFYRDKPESDIRLLCSGLVEALIELNLHKKAFKDYRIFSFVVDFFREKDKYKEVFKLLDGYDYEGYKKIVDEQGTSMCGSDYGRSVYFSVDTYSQLKTEYDFLNEG